MNEKNYNEVSLKNCTFSISSVLVIQNLLLFLGERGEVLLMEKPIVSRWSLLEHLREEPNEGNTFLK